MDWNQSCSTVPSINIKTCKLILLKVLSKIQIVVKSTAKSLFLYNFSYPFCWMWQCGAVCLMRAYEKSSDVAINLNV